MNAFHKTVWNPARQQYIVTSEIARGRTKSASTSTARARRGLAARPPGAAFSWSVRSRCLLAAGLLMPGMVFASSCQTGTPDQSAPAGGQCAVANYNPPVSNGGVGEAVVTNGDTVTLHGTSQVGTGYSGNTTVPANTVNAISGTFNSSALVTGPQNIAVSARNAATGTNVVFRAFDSAAFLDKSNLDTPVNQFEDVNGDMYYNASLGRVDQSGGTLNVNLGATPAGSPSSNSILMVSKQTYLTSADGSGGADSKVVWHSRNAIDMGIDPGLPTPDQNGRLTVEVPVTTYAGTVNFNGVDYTVTNVAQLAAYNDALVAALKNGMLTTQQAYDDAFAKAFTTVDMPVTYMTNTSDGDLTRAPNGDRYAILATGARGSANIAAGAQIDITRASGAVKASNGAVVTNHGILSGNVIQQVAQVESGARFVNEVNGVVSAGYLAGDKANTATDGLFYYTGSGVMATGAGTTVLNKGVINVSGMSFDGYTTTGLGLANGASGSNVGAINVGVNPDYTAKVVGVNVSGGSTFTNAAGGTIYIGRAAQYALGDAVPDVAISGPTYGVRIMDTGDTAVNNGQIVIGAQAQNAVGMYSTAPINSLLLNNGTININGAAGGMPMANIGMLADDNGAAGTGAVARNAGTININGVNGIGVMVNADPGIAANAESTGTINVNGNADPASGTRNFGVWVDGAQGVASISGAVNLAGIGAVGAFAQNGGTINVAAGSVPQFLGGTDQIGFYAAGAGSAINVSASTMIVNTERSTLFRVADGAAFTGASSAGAFDVTVSGTDARGVVATGSDTTLSTGTSRYRVTGAAGSAGGAVAIVNEGGASGTIDAGTVIDLASAGATAGIVDGQGHDITGAAWGDPVATTLTNNAAIQSATNGVTGFVARNLGTLVNNSNITLMGASSIGVVVGPQGSVRNNATIQVSNGDGALVQGANASLVNNGVIRADDGHAAVHLTGAGASVTISGTGLIQAQGTADGILLDPTAVGGSVTGMAGSIVVNGTGMALDNQAPGGIIALSDTMITTSGQGSAGISTSGANGDVVVTGGRIETSGAGAAGVLISGDSTVRLSNVTIAAAGNAIDVTGAKANISVQPGTTLTAATGTLLNLTNASVVNFDAQGVSLNGDLIADASSSGLVSLRDGTTLTGRIDPLSVSIDSSSAWNVTANSEVATLSNAGNVAFIAPTGDPTQGSSYKTITASSYTGTNGTIAMNTYVAGDGAPSDRLVINGGTATGTTALRINNTGGGGARTTGDGINLIGVTAGGTTAPGAFRLASPVQAGAYEYLLYRGGSASADDYYLRSTLGGPAAPGDSTPVGPPAYRPGVVGYALMPALNLDYGFAMLGRLHERVGDIHATEQNQKGNRDGVWGRIGGDGLNADSGDRFSVNQHTFFMQFGKDWTLSQSEEGGSTHAGITATLGVTSADFKDSKRDLNATLSDDAGGATTQAQSLGGYYTKYWRDGTYWDSVGQVTRYRNKYDDTYGNGDSQDGYGIALSQEVGKPFLLGSKLAIEPQAQLVYQYLHLDSFNDGVSSVSGNSSNALRGRIGFRLFAPNLRTEDGAGAGTPYLTFDVLHDFIPPRAVTVGGTSFRSDFSRTWAEVGFGISQSVGKGGQLYANVKLAKNLGGDDRKGVFGQVGYRYSW